GMPRNLDDLASHRLIHYSPILGARPAGFEYEVDGATRMLQMQGSVTVNNADAYEAACLGGLGLIQAPQHGARDHLRSGALVEVLPASVAAPTPAPPLYAHRPPPPPRVGVFMEWPA